MTRTMAILLVLWGAVIGSVGGRMGGFTPDAPAAEDGTQVVQGAAPSAPEPPPSFTPPAAWQGETIVVATPTEDIGLFDLLPPGTELMSNELFAKWAKAQNGAACKRAVERADAHAERYPIRYALAAENTYTLSSLLDQTDSATYTSARVKAHTSTSYSGRNVQVAMPVTTRWGGGPVVIINPYVR